MEEAFALSTPRVCRVAAAQREGDEFSIGLLMARLANSKMAVIAAKPGQTCVPVRALTAQNCGCASERMGLAEFLETS